MTESLADARTAVMLAAFRAARAAVHEIAGKKRRYEWTFEDVPLAEKVDALIEAAQRVARAGMPCSRYSMTRPAGEQPSCLTLPPPKGGHPRLICPACEARATPVEEE